MTHALLLSLLLLAAPGARPRPVGSRLQVAQQQYNRGEFDAALQVLDTAAKDTRDERTLGRIHLLRGQCYAALRDAARSEEALVRALDADPEAALDPERVDPTLVQQLEDLRARTRGELRVRVNRAGARVLVDGRPMGVAPLRTALPIGRHTVEVRSADGKQRASEQTVVRAGRTGELSFSLAAEAPAAPPAPQPAPVALDAPVQSAAAAEPRSSAEHPRPIADVRLALHLSQLGEAPGIEVGGGLQSEHLRATLHAQLFRDFGLTLRGAAIVPVTGRFRGYVSAELPVIFIEHGPAVGLGGAAGAEYAMNPWLALFGELGARHFFTAGDWYESNRVTLQGGARLRLP